MVLARLPDPNGPPRKRPRSGDGLSEGLCRFFVPTAQRLRAGDDSKCFGAALGFRSKSRTGTTRGLGPPGRHHGLGERVSGLLALLQVNLYAGDLRECPRTIPRMLDCRDGLERLGYRVLCLLCLADLNLGAGEIGKCFGPNKSCTDSHRGLKDRRASARSPFGVALGGCLARYVLKQEATRLIGS